MLDNSQKESLQQLIDRAHKNSVDHGFWGGQVYYDDSGIRQIVGKNKGEMIALMHSELSECLEGIRKPSADSHCPMFDSEVVELADVLIRVFDYAGGFGLPLVDAIEAKMKFNESRPHKDGKKF